MIKPDLNPGYLSRVLDSKKTHFQKNKKENILDGLFSDGSYDNPDRFGIRGEPRKDQKQLIGFEALLWNQVQKIIELKSSSPNSHFVAVDFGGRMGYTFRRLALEAEKKNLVSSGKARFIITNAGKFDLGEVMETLTLARKEEEIIDELISPTKNLVELVDQTTASNLNSKIKDIDLLVASYSVQHSLIPESDLWLLGRSMSEYGEAFFHPKIGNENETVGILNMNKLGIKEIEMPPSCHFNVFCKTKSPLSSFS